MADTPSRQDEHKAIMLHPTAGQRRLVSKPLGELIAKPSGALPAILRDRFLRAGARISFCVGDAVTSTLIRGRIPFEVAVVDARIRRRAVAIPGWIEGRIFRVRNPKGYLNPSALEVMRGALSVGAGAIVVVEGEEDLLTLFAIDLSREGDLVVYGQPGEGAVVVRVDAGVKKRNSEFLNSIPRVEAESH